VGNRAFGERILSYGKPAAVRAVMAILLLAPFPPLLFMGEEFAASSPFLFFCDFEADLAKAVTEGRRAEFAKFAQFRDAATRDRIPDPNAASTFCASRIDWKSLNQPGHTEWLRFYSHLLKIRQSTIVPLLQASEGKPEKTSFSTFSTNGLNVCWQFGNNVLRLQANLDENSTQSDQANRDLLYSTFDIADGTIPAWSVAWFVSR